MYYIGKAQFLIFIGGVVAVFIVSTAAQNLVDRAAVALDRDTRDRIWKRQIMTLWWWRGPDILGVALMLAGIVRQFGVVRFFPGAWAVPAVAGGLVLVCLSSTARAWLASQAYAAVARGSTASRSAVRAAIVVTIAELALAAAICGYVFTHLPRTSSSQQTPPADTSGRETNPPPEEGGQPKDLFWVDEADALRLLKDKNSRYLKALARRGDIRGKVENGRTLYRRDDISATIGTPMPTLEELEEDLKNQGETKPKPPDGTVKE